MQPQVAPDLMVMNKIIRHQAGLKPCSYDGWVGEE